MKNIMLIVGLLTLSACAAPMSKVTEEGFLVEVPEGVVALAAPGQDLTTVQLNPDDGCFWYQHKGPVETTMLPLRTLDGRNICAQAQEPLKTAM